MANFMALQALLLSCDPETVRVMRSVLEHLDIGCESSSAPEKAGQLLTKRRFDAVIIDCDDMPGAANVLRQLRQAPSNKRAMAFALVNGGTTVRQAFDLGANFVLDKPLSVERTQRSFRAAHGLMMRERRRYLRTPLKGSAVLTTADGSEVQAKIKDLSEGGISLQVSAPLGKKASVRIRFHLPRGNAKIEAKGEITWSDEAKAIGVRFLHVEQGMQRQLEQWLAQQVDGEKSMPVFINAAARAR